jgi:hypothetical protein
MSYYIATTVFKGIVEQSDVLEKALAFCKDQYKNHFHDIVQDHMIYMPDFGKYKADTELYDIDRADREYLRHIFEYKFIYWKKYKMLGVVGDYEKTYTNMGTMFFQNSCDQNADYAMWDALMDDDKCRDEFKKLVKDVRSGRKTNEIEEYFKKEYEGFNDEDDEYGSNEYYMQTYVYRIIEDALDIDGILWDRVNDDDIIVFELGHPITNMVNIYTEMAKCIQEYYRD